MTDKMLIDTNILVYAYGKSEPKHEIAATRLKEAIGSGKATLSNQNLAEFSSVMTQKLGAESSHAELRKIVEWLSKTTEVIGYDPESVLLALKISEKENIHFFDSLLIATMTQKGIGTIMTENEKDFQIQGITIVNPFKT